jgi:hypothetical protein
MNTKSILRSTVAAFAIAAVAGPITAHCSVFGQWQPPSPLDGAWKVAITPVICATGVELTFFTVQNLVTFASGGTVVDATSNPDLQPGQRSTGLGYWERTGRKSYHAYVQAFLQFDTVDPPPPPARSYLRGIQSFDHRVEMLDSNHWTSTATVTFTDISGATVYSSGCAKAVAERME